jgi:hypothetical protein|tara:strand:- start:454 stop:888 length:435 start_codon:yes stop_codon:yes gene_type:complete
METKKNIIFSCSEHGREQYFKIQKLGEKRNYDCAYVWFQFDRNPLVLNADGHAEYKGDSKPGVERMWVKVIKGDKKNGGGVLINTPVLEPELKHGDYIEYKTHKDNITYAKNCFEGPFCECCGELEEDHDHENTNLDFGKRTVH